MKLENRIAALKLFQTKFKGDCNDEFTKLSDEKINLRINMYDEEAEEFLKAHRTNDKVEELDAICDELFLTIGDAVCFGVHDNLLDSDIYKLNSDIGIFKSPKLITLLSLMDSEELRVNKEEVVTESCRSRINMLVRKANLLYGDKHLEIVEKGMEVVEASNMSKLGDDGEPIYNHPDHILYDEKKPIGKILKNPTTYFEPTETLTQILKEYGIN